MSEFLNRAFMAHANVKNRLKRAIVGEEEIDPAVIRRDDVCEVGKWIHGEGKSKFAAHPLFQEFRKVHADFHSCAHNVMMLYKGGKVREAEAEIDRGAFEKKSSEIGNCIMKMKRDPAFAE